MTIQFVVKPIGIDIWWAYMMTIFDNKVEFIGDIFQGPFAEKLAREWRHI